MYIHICIYVYAFLSAFLYMYIYIHPQEPLTALPDPDDLQEATCLTADPSQARSVPVTRSNQRDQNAGILISKIPGSFFC